MENELQAVIQEELTSGERLIWTGRPKQGVIFRSHDLFFIPFSLLWCGFAIFWETMAILMNVNDIGIIGIIFPIFGLPFVLVGLYLVFGRFFYDAKKRRNTFYGLTDKRIIIITDVFCKIIKTIELKTLTEISIKAKKDGSGTICFGNIDLLYSMFLMSRFPAPDTSTPRLDMIENVREVYNMIRDQHERRQTS